MDDPTTDHAADVDDAPPLQPFEEALVGEEAAANAAADALEREADAIAADTALDAVEEPVTGAGAIEDALRDTTDAIGAPAAAASSTTPAADVELLTEVRCPKCNTRASWRGQLTAERVADPENTFHERGLADSGLPNCPHCGTPMETVNFLKATDAIAAAAQQLDTERAGDAARPPYQPSLPGTRPPFDFRRAQLTTESLERNVDEAEKAWDAAKEEAADRKKDFDRAVEALRKHIRDASASRQETEYEARRRGDGPAPRQLCAFEQTTGTPCSICTEAGRTPTPKDETLQHLATALIVDTQQGGNPETLRAAIAKIAKRELEPFIVSSWSTEEREDVAAWLERLANDLALGSDTTSADVPTPLGRAHETDAVGGCRVCGALLHPLAQARGLEGWPLGTLVGTDCPGEPAQEPARRPAKRHAKKADAVATKQDAAKQEAAKAEPPPRAPKPKPAKATLKKSAKKGGRR